MENKKTPITVNNKEYFYEDLDGQQQLLVNHVADLEKKMNTTRFNLEQLQVGHGKFMELLVAALEPETTETVQ